MYRSTLSAALLFLFCANTYAQTSFAVVDIGRQTVTLDYESPTSCASDIPFAFSSLPHVGVSIQVRNGTKTTHLEVAAQGWVGSAFLRWVNLPCTASPAPDATAGSSRIIVHFSSPILLPDRPASIRNGIAFLPLQSTLRKQLSYSPSEIAFSRGLKIAVDQDGIYELSGKFLQSKGVPLASIDSRSFRLFCGTSEIPISVTNPYRSHMHSDDKLLFYGRHLRGESRHYAHYSNSNIYWLTWDTPGVGLRIAPANGALVIDPTHYRGDNATVNDLYAREFRDTLHIEQDNDILWMGTIETPQELQRAEDISSYDHWFWGSVGANELSHFPLKIPSPSTQGQARITLSFQGQTRNMQHPADHRVTVLLNDKALVSDRPQVAEWDGQTPYVFTSDLFPSSRFLHGDNTLTLLVERRGFPDLSSLNWVRIDYSRGFQTLGDRMHFSSHPLDRGTRKQFSLQGFSSPKIDLWDIQTHRIFGGFSVSQQIGVQEGMFDVSFQDSIPRTAKYYAATASQRLQPTNALLDSVPGAAGLFLNAGPIDYVMITSRAFLSTMKPLADYHRSQGLHVALVSVEDLYNRYSFGRKDPESIRSFLRHLAALYPESPPRYLLLGGDTSHDLDKRNQEQNVVPTHLSFAPGWGPCSDDGYFAQIIGDDPFPDLYVGRLPAQSASHLKTMVDKTVAYLKSPGNGYWRDNMLCIGGLEQEFTDFNDALITQVVHPRMNVQRIDAQPGSPYYVTGYTGTKRLADLVNSGLYAINFCGHGGGNVWWDSKLFSFTDLSLLHNDQWGPGGRLPIVFSFTCLTGFFESTMYGSLGEEFVRQSSAGAVAFYGASAYTSRAGNFLMNRILMEEAVDGPIESLGELLWLCEIKTLAADQTRWLPLVRQYNLLGDPALPWNLPPKDLSIGLVKQALAPGDTLKITGTTRTVPKGSAKLRVHNGWATVDEAIVSVKDSSFDAAFVLKDSLSIAQGMVRGYAWNDSVQARGWAAFSKNLLLVHDMGIHPSRPSPGDTAHLSCRITLPDSSTIPAIRLLYAFDSPTAIPINFSAERSLQRDSSGVWHTSSPLQIPHDLSPGVSLHTKLRILGSYGESEVFVFPLGGKPSLRFTDRTPSLTWTGDSLAFGFEISNAGNSSATGFEILLTVDSGTTTALAEKRLGPLTLDAGKSLRLTPTLPDLSGAFGVSVVIDPDKSLDDALRADNSYLGRIEIVSGNLHSTTDTLYSSGHGLSITPLQTLSSPCRAFLFPESLSDTTPLPTSSRWLGVTGGSLRSYRLACRPGRTTGDSLVWIFRLDTTGASAKRSAQDDSGKYGCMLYDSTIGTWRYLGGKQENASGTILHMHSIHDGPIAPAFIGDTRPPEIDLSVAGRTIRGLDYAAKDHSFDIFLADPSGILPGSVRVHLNGTALPQERLSEIDQTSAPIDLRLTAYPAKKSSVDSLSITAADLAGNDTTAVFTYLPGEDLSIRFLACHPNPFTARQNTRGETIRPIRFAFLLTDLAESVTITLFTISGTKVRVWNLRDLIGYQEIPWDGKSQSGYRIANGTYYLKLVAGNNRKTVEKITKIAKLEGY